MKTKNKVIALLEITVVLCSVFLVAIPVVAADQNQAMQKVSTSDVTTASEDDYVLGVYGNANEDDTIDMGDVVYTKLAIFGKKPKTELCDAKYDGRINVLDVIQTKLIILSKEKELTIVDPYDRIVTVKKPIKRMVVTFRMTLELLRTLKVPKDIIIGVDSYAQTSGGTWGIDNKMFFPEFSDLPPVSSKDPESILNLHPDVVLIWPSSGGLTVDVLESAGITVICVYSSVQNRNVVDEAKTLGYIFERRDEAKEFIDFYENILNSMDEKVERITEEDKPKVFFWRDCSVGTPDYTTYYTLRERLSHIERTGGKNIFPDMQGIVDAEAVIKRNPDIIVREVRQGCYHLDADDTGLKEAREGIMSLPELQNVKAVKEGKVYAISGCLLSYGPSAGCRGFLQLPYQAKWFHPELFKDLNPKAIHQEYLTRFQGLDIDLDEVGVFVYQEPS
jgi:iron complex transport system substrate-binding protein